MSQAEFLHPVPPAQSRGDRIGRYRVLAAEAFSAASRTADPTIRASYLDIACGWQGLVLELEQSGQVAGADQIATRLPVSDRVSPRGREPPRA